MFNYTVQLFYYYDGKQIGSWVKEGDYITEKLAINHYKDAIWDASGIVSRTNCFDGFSIEGFGILKENNTILRKIEFNSKDSVF